MSLSAGIGTLFILIVSYVSCVIPTHAFFFKSTNKCRPLFMAARDICYSLPATLGFFLRHDVDLVDELAMNLIGNLDIVRLTDVGLQRDHNEDAVASDPSIGLIVLADGMGGYQAGEVASEMAVLSIVAELKEALLDFEAGQMDRVTGMQLESRLVHQAAARANAHVYEVSQAQPQCAGMGTTLVLSLFTNDKILVGHIGDSRAYRWRAGRLQQLTQDHSMLQEQINFGWITPDQARHSPQKYLVTRALGVDPEVELELHEYEVIPEDIYLLCSDGLSDLLEEQEICLTLSALSDNLELAAQQLVQKANAQGGKDNISVVLARTSRPFPARKNWRRRLMHWMN
jgi:serine/threonine protein phosphatase PrpC